MLVRFLPARGVKVHALYARVRKHRLDHAFHALGADARVLERGVGAFRAERRRAACGPAEVAAQLAGLLVVGEGYAALVAAGNEAAFWAHEARGKAAPVEEKYCLLGVVEAFANGCHKGLRQHARLARFGRLGALVHDPHHGHFPVIHARVHGHERVFPGHGVVV